jgi:hypothetical protein
MSGRKLVRHAALGLATTVVAGTVTFAGSGSAAAAPSGVVCITNKFTVVRSSPRLREDNHLYNLDAGRGFRLTGEELVNGGINWYVGNGNNKALGWVPSGNLSCPF